MSTEPSNAVLLTMLEALKDSVDELKKHVKEQNGKVNKNTEFKNKVIGGMIVLSALGLGELAWLFNISQQL